MSDYLAHVGHYHVEAPPVEMAVPPLSWPERIENYRRNIGIAYLGYESGWTYGTWFMGNSYEKRNDYYGGFQDAFLKRIAALFPDRRRALHLFAGKVDLERFPGDTLDIRPELAPTYCTDAETCAGVPLADYDFVLADPPYSASDAERYGTSMVNRNKVVRTLSQVCGPAHTWRGSIRCIRCLPRSC